MVPLWWSPHAVQSSIQHADEFTSFRLINGRPLQPLRTLQYRRRQMDSSYTVYLVLQCASA
jgi:hypothetical protein